MTPAAELELVDQARTGDEEAFEALLRALIPVGYRLACGMLQDRQLAEDAVQEAAMSAWRKLHQLRSGSRIEPWFLGIVANQCRTIRRTRWWSVLKVDPSPPLTDPADDRVVAGADLRRALARLNPDLRLVVILYYYLDLPLQEIATITGASFAAVRGRLYRAVKSLKPDLEIIEVQA